MNTAKDLAEVFNMSLNEARVYLVLNNQGSSMVSSLGKSANLARSAVYPPLESLVRKGFVGTTMSGKRKYYTAVSPEQLRNFIEQKKVTLESLIAEMRRKEQIVSLEHNLDIVHYPGKSGIQTAAQIFMEETREKIWYSFESPIEITELIGVNFLEEYVTARVKRGIYSKVILSSTVDVPWLRDFMKKDKEQLREVITINPREYPFDSTIAVTKGITHLINGNGSPFSVIIRNDNLARNLMSVHKLIWSRYKE
ncbi:MAG TPA: helix-turn-helix domain-containing protein [Candidatus Paceibacterota bacterium]